MAKRKFTPLDSPLESNAVREAAQALIEAVQHEGVERGLTPSAYTRSVRELERLRGRPLVYPILASGTGRGARVWLADGSMKLDFIGGIGVYGLGRGDHDLLQAAVVAAAGDVVFQGHLAPGPEYLRLSRALLKHAGPRLKHVWLSLTGSDANENALKIMFQKHAPADKVAVFEGGFHGRTSLMAELTDRPGFRDGQPLAGRALYVPFYDPSDPDSTQKSVNALNAHLSRYPGRIAAMVFEIIQGEGGFRIAPREFHAALMERCHKASVGVWVDEIQTFARTGMIFAFRAFGLDDLVDVVTAGKTLQGSAVLFTKEYNPRPGLVAGTYAGSTVAMAVGARIIERLESDGYLGPDGRTIVLGRRIRKRFESLRKRMPKAVGEVRGLGAMQAFVPWHGSPEIVKDVLTAAFDAGLILLGAGANPTLIRMLPPVNTTDEELEACFTMLEKALRSVAEDHELPC